MVNPLRSRPPDPVPIHSRALDNLTYIRQTMETATGFTAVPGWGGVGMGGTALIAALIATTTASREAWLLVWLIDAALALGLGGWAMARKARRAGQRVSQGAGRRFVLSLGPPLMAAGLLTAVLYRAGATDAIPGMWLLLYGVGVVCGGTYSVRLVPLMGICFMGVGAITLLAPVGWNNAMMALGFGGLHVLFGAIIAGKHGG